MSTQSEIKDKTGVTVPATAKEKHAAQQVVDDQRDKDAPDYLPIEAYPCFTGDGGLTFRVDRDVDGAQPLWVESSVAMAKKIVADIETAIRDAERDGKPKDIADAKASVGIVKDKPLPTWWEWFDADVDGTERAGQVVVHLVNKNGVVPTSKGVWFASVESADEIIDRLNNR